MTENVLVPVLGVVTDVRVDTPDVKTFRVVALDGNTYATLAEAQEAGAATLNYGTFLNVILNFLIMAVVVFVMVKTINTMREKAKKKEAPAPAPAPTTRVCPFCKTEISIEATRCPHCTSQIDPEN